MKKRKPFDFGRRILKLNIVSTESIWTYGHLVICQLCYTLHKWGDLQKWQYKFIKGRLN